MNMVVVDTLFRSRLENLDSPMELCDESGTTLEYFVPASDREWALYKRVQESVTDEELQRAFDEPGQYTIEEVLANLKDR